MIHDVILWLTLIAFIALACITLECIMRFDFWSAWAVFVWFLTVDFAWLLTADVLAKACDFMALSQAPLRSGVFRSLVLFGAFQWLCRYPRGRAHG